MWKLTHFRACFHIVKETFFGMCVHGNEIAVYSRAQKN